MLRFLARNRMLQPALRAAPLALPLAAPADARRAGAGAPTASSSSAAAWNCRSSRGAQIRFGRFVWIGDGTKIRCHEGVVEIGAKTVMGQECTISAYQRVRIGEQCVIADRAMFIDFDHGVVEVERPIRLQGIYKRDVEVGSNVWIGYGACILRGVSVGDNSIDRHQLGGHQGRPRQRRRRRHPGPGHPHARGAARSCAGRTRSSRELPPQNR